MKFKNLVSLIVCIAVALFILLAIIPPPDKPNGEEDNSYSKKVQIVDSCSKETYTIRADDSTGIQIVFQDAKTSKHLLKLEQSLNLKDSEILNLKLSIDSLKLKDKQIIRQYKKADKNLFESLDTLIAW